MNLSHLSVLCLLSFLFQVLIFSTSDVASNSSEAEVRKCLRESLTNDLEICNFEQGNIILLSYPPVCSLEEQDECKILEQSECGKTNSASKSQPIYQRFLYEVIGAVIINHVKRYCWMRQRSRPPKHIQKTLPWLKRKRWISLSYSFTKNPSLLYVFYGRLGQRCCSISCFLLMIYHMQRMAVRTIVASILTFAINNIILYLSWVQFLALFMICCTSHTITLLYITTSCALWFVADMVVVFANAGADKIGCIHSMIRDGTNQIKMWLANCIAYIFDSDVHEIDDERWFRFILETGEIPSDEDFDGVWELAYQDAIMRNNARKKGAGKENKFKFIITQCIRFISSCALLQHAKQALLGILVFLSFPTLAAATKDATTSSSSPSSIPLGAAVVGIVGLAAARRSRKRPLSSSERMRNMRSRKKKAREELTMDSSIHTDVSAVDEQSGVSEAAAEQSLLTEVFAEQSLPPSPFKEGQSSPRRRSRSSLSADAKPLSNAERKRKSRTNQKNKAKEEGVPAIDPSVSTEAAAVEEVARVSEAAAELSLPPSSFTEGPSSPQRRIRSCLSADAKPLSGAERMRKSRANQKKNAEEESISMNVNVSDENELEDIADGLDEVIANCTKECQQILIGGTQVGDNGSQHQARVCVICERLIKIGDDSESLSKDTLLQCKEKLSFERYENRYGRRLHQLVRQQYQVSDKDLKDMILSPYARCGNDGYETCVSCHRSLTRSTVKSPPKFSIANGFIIGTIPEVLRYKKKDGEEVTYEFPEDKLTDLLCAAIAVVRPFAYVFAYMATAVKSIKGHFTFFDTDQEYLGRAVKYLRGIRNNNIFCVLCGRMTPSQREEARRRAELNTEDYLNLLNWFILESGHDAYKSFTPPDNCPQPSVIMDPENEHNTNYETNALGEECPYEGGTFYMSSTSDPQDGTGVFDSKKNFVKAMISGNAPSMLVGGGNFTNRNELKLESVCPIQFPFGLGHPAEDREVTVGKAECLKHYIQLGRRQFMRGDFILIVYHMFNRLRSFDSGIMMTRATSKDGESFGQRISKLTEKDIADAGKRKSMNIDMDKSSDADVFLKKVDTASAAIGHTPAAAKIERRNAFAMMEFYGPPAIFATVTPDDLCSAHVTINIRAGKIYNLLPLDDELESGDVFKLDFKMRSKNRLAYPGASALYYEGITNLVMKVLFRWDKKKQRGEKGVVGVLEAALGATEEQSRKSLHLHLLLWIVGFNKIRSALFHPSKQRRDRARKLFIRYVDKVMANSYGDEDFKITHVCNGNDNQNNADEIVCVSDIFQADAFPPPNEAGQEKLDILRRSRHKAHSYDIAGRIHGCMKCQQEFSSVDIINNALETWQLCAKRDGALAESIVPLPLTKEHLDVAAYRFPYDFDVATGECRLKHRHPFFNDYWCRKVLMNLRMNEHAFYHCSTCFVKASNECRSKFPKPTQLLTVIDDGEENDEKWKSQIFYRLDGSEIETRAYNVIPRRPLGSEYLNTHNNAISSCLGCNTNMQISNPKVMFYTINYTTKDTQKADNEVHIEVVKRCTNHIIRAKEREEIELAEIRKDSSGNDEAAPVANGEEAQNEKDRASYIKGLSLFLSALQATLSRFVCSSTLAHYIMLNDGERFFTTSDHSEMSVVQMIDVLEGRPTTLRVRRTKNQKGDLKIYPDCFADDYRYRPVLLESMCFYEQTMRYNRVFSKLKVVDGKEEQTKNAIQFNKDHPAYEFSYLEKRKFPIIPRTSLPEEEKLCTIKDLDLANESIATGVLHQRRETYAKIALVMFYPFRTLEDLKLNDRYWDKFMHEKKRLKESLPAVEGAEDMPKFWAKGIEILENIDCRISMDKLPTPDDILKRHTTGDDTEDDRKEEVDDPQRIDISDFDFEQDRDPFYDCHGRGNDDDPLSCDGIIERGNIDPSHLRRVNLSLDTPSVLIGDDKNDQKRTETKGNKTQSPNNTAVGSSDKKWNYATVLKFLCGSIVGDFSSQDNVDKDECMTDKQKTGELPLPSLDQIAEKMSKKEGKTLDYKQRIAYEILACSFILELVEGPELEEAFDKASSNKEEAEKYKKKLIANLEARCAKKNLIMFLTGPAGSGKSTAVEVAQRYCFEVCMALNIIWDKSFLFTSTTGSSAALFGGLTVHSATHLMKTMKNITDDMKEEFKHIRLLIVDEISYFSIKDIRRLSKHLQFIRNRHDLPFGGLPIVFSGDFHQLLPVSCHKDDLLFSAPKGSSEWRELVDTIVVLENKHRFKDDPDFGDLLNRMWKGEVTQEDRDLINSRVIGCEGLALPDAEEMIGDVAYACALNSERNSVNRAIFKDHIENSHPKVTSEEQPPAHTVLIEALVSSEASKNQSGQTRVPRHIIDSIMCHCGDSDVRTGKDGSGVKIDPLLPIYPGAKMMATNNKLLSKGVGNGTVCTVVGIKMKKDDGGDTRIRVKNWFGYKVNTVLASDVEYIRLQHFPAETPKIKSLQAKVDGMKEQEILSDAEKTELKRLETDLEAEKQKRFFDLKPQTYKATAHVPLDSEGIYGKLKYVAKFFQFPLNSNDATTGHKLQGMSKDYVIVTSWNGVSKWENWPYTIISRARQLKGFFMCKPLPSSISFELPEELKAYEQFMFEKERQMLEKREFNLKRLREAGDDLDI